MLSFDIPWNDPSDVTMTVADLQARLSEVQEELRLAHADCRRSWRRLSDCKTQLKRERYLHQLAVAYIPKDRKDDYMLEWPCGQIEWTGSSSPVSAYFRVHTLQSQSSVSPAILMRHRPPYVTTCHCRRHSHIIL